MTDQIGDTFSETRAMSAGSSTVAIMDEHEPELTWDEKLVVVAVFAVLTRRPETGAFRTAHAAGCCINETPGGGVPKLVP